jgi:hypothetical protein
MSEMQEIEEEDIPKLMLHWQETDLLKGKLTEAVKAALSSRDLSCEQIMKLGAFLWLVDHLPQNHKRYSAKFELAYDYGDGASWMTATISQDGLALSTGEVIRGDFGSDHSSKTVFQVSRYSNSEYDINFDLEDHLLDFVNDAGDPNVKFSIDWSPELETPSEHYTDF